jgi:outer membrane usher protein
VQIRVNDVTGVSQSLNLNTYVDTLDLAPGDYEYGAYLGVLAPTSLLTPQYTGQVAFSGFYRKAFLNRQAFGVGLQASADTQVLNGEYRFIVLNGAKLDVLAAGSHSDKLGSGVSLETLFDQAFDRGQVFDDLSIQVRYDTARFTTLGETLLTPNTTAAWQVSTTYRRGNTIKWDSDVSLNYTAGNGLKAGTYDARFDNDYLISRFWRIRATLEYERGGGTGIGNGVGGQLSLIWRPTFRTDYEADVDSLRRTETVSATRSTDNSVGSLGYSVVADNSNGEAGVTGTGEYVGNRYDAGVSVATQGAGVGSVGDQQVITGRIGTSIAFVDGHFAVGRQIIDSFAMGYADQNLGKDPVIMGQSLDGGHYDADSGLFGPALYGRLQSYTTQELHYDVLDAPAGYDVGPGVAYLKPAYHSGYAIKVGGDAYISAGGSLVGDGAKPVRFVSGRVSSTTDKAFKPTPFFTNSVGRFAIADLRAGMRYRVDLNTATPAFFEFVTPKDGKALLNLQTVTIKLPVD